MNFFLTANDPSHIVSWAFSDIFALSKHRAWIFIVLDPQANSYSMIILFIVKYWWLKKGSLSNQGLCCLLSACTLAKLPESMWILCNYIQKWLNPNMWCLFSFSVERKRQREGLNFKSQNCRINSAGILWLTVPFLGSSGSRHNLQCPLNSSMENWCVCHVPLLFHFFWDH